MSTTGCDFIPQQLLEEVAESLKTMTYSRALLRHQADQESIFDVLGRCCQCKRGHQYHDGKESMIGHGLQGYGTYYTRITSHCCLEGLGCGDGDGGSTGVVERSGWGHHVLKTRPARQVSEAIHEPWLSHATRCSEPDPAPKYSVHRSRHLPRRAQSCGRVRT